ncbi:MAG TPA: AAA family ATPase [Solirubrobacter sp.]
MSQRITSPRLIGRDSQLALLRELCADAARGTFALALIKGDAGIGKSRLVFELEAAQECHTALVLRGNCFPIAGEDAPYGPLVTALRRTPAAVLEAAAGALPPAMVAELAVLLPTLPHAGEAVRDSSRGAQGRQYEYLLELLARIAEPAPVVLVIEDIHWADPSTLDFLSFIARNAREERLLVVVTHRLHDGPDMRALELYVDQLERCPAVTSILVEPLTEREVQEQIEAILSRPADVSSSSRISARTQGNPFYVEELIAHGGTSETPLTAGQAAALLERVRALPPDAQHVVGVLAAFGRAVHHDLVAAASGVADPAFSAALRSAVDAHVVVADATALTYRHALTREAVYDALLPGERRQLHASGAAALCERPDMTDAAELAVQWRAAEEPAAALAASIVAARAATEVYAYSEAVEHYTAVVSLWGPTSAQGLDVDRAQLLLDAADAAYRAGVDELPIQWCRLGLEALGDEPDTRRAAEFFERLGRFQDHHLDRSLSFYSEALASLDEAPSAERARLLGDESLTLTLSVRWDEARDRAERALAVAQQASAHAEEGFARSVLGLVLAYLGDFESAEAHLTEAIRIGEALQRPEDVSRAYVHMGEIRRLGGDLAGALEMMAAGVDAARRLGVEASYGRYFALNAAEDEFELGRWDEAQARIDELEGASLTWSETVLRLTVSGQLAAGRGEFERARAWLDDAGAQLRSTSATEWTAYVGASAIELLVTEGAADAALAAGIRELERVRGQEEELYTPGLVAVTVRAAADVAAAAKAANAPAVLGAEQQVEWLSGFLSAGSPPIALAHLASARAEVQRARGEWPAASWEAVAAEWDRLEHPYRAAYAHFRQAEAILAGKGDRGAATAALAHALAVAESLRAAPLIGWIDALSQRARLKRAVVRQVGNGRPDEHLTNREREVLLLVAEGRTNREIGSTLFITERTAGLHVSRVIGKLGVNNRSQAAAIARELGLSGGAA